MDGTVLIEVSDPDPASQRGGLVSRTSLARGKALSPGIQAAPFYWRDLVTGPPPRKRVKGDALHVTFHGTDDEGDVRISISTIVRVDPGADIDSALDDVIHVEERLNLQRRALQELIDRERAFSDRLAMRWRSRLARGLVAQRRAANRVKVAWLVTLMIWLIRFQAKVGNGAIRATRGVLRGIVAVPDFVLSRSDTASVHLGSRTGRRAIWRAFRDPSAASPAEKSILLVVVAFALAGTVLLLNTVFGPIFAQAAPVYRNLLLDFGASLASTIALPIPAEPILIARTLTVGAALAFLGLFLGKMMGSWMLYLLGDSLNDGIEKKTAKSPRMKRVVGWMQDNADRWGFWLLIPINAIPFLPDLLVYVFAVSGMKFSRFMSGIAVGTALKFAAIIYAVYLVGPDVVHAFLEHPIQTLRGG